MKSVFCFFDNLKEIENITILLNNNNYNVKNSSILSINNSNNIKNRFHTEIFINNLLETNNGTNIIEGKTFLLNEDNFFVLTGPMINFIDSKQLSDLNELFLTIGIEEENINYYLDLLQNNNILFSFPINEKNQDEISDLLEKNNAKNMKIN